MSCVVLQTNPNRPPVGQEPLGELQWARMAKHPGWLPSKEHRTGRQAMGVRYEKRVHQEFQRRYGDYYFESPWFVFKEMEAERPRFCQPDGLLIDIQQGRIIIVEAKYSHTSDAWWQLQRYGSVVSKAFSPNSEFAVIGLEVCKWFDPAVRAPQKPTMCSDLHYANQGSFNVHIWRP